MLVTTGQLKSKDQPGCHWGGGEGGRCDLAGADGGKSEDDRMQAGQEERSMAVAGVRYIGTAPKQGRRRPHRT